MRSSAARGARGGETRLAPHEGPLDDELRADDSARVATLGAARPVSPPLSLPPGPPSSNASMVDHSEEWGLEDQTTPRTEAGPLFGPTTQADIAEEDEARLTASPPPKFGASPRKDSGAPVCSGRLRMRGCASPSSWVAFPRA